MFRLVRRVMGAHRLAAPIPVVLWGKADCCLCDRAGEILDKLAREYPLQVEKRDITADPSAFERYRYLIPVVEIQGGLRFEGKISEFRLRQALDRRVQPGG